MDTAGSFFIRRLRIFFVVLVFALIPNMTSTPVSAIMESASRDPTPISSAAPSSKDAAISYVPIHGRPGTLSTVPRHHELHDYEGDSYDLGVWQGATQGDWDDAIPIASTTGVGSDLDSTKLRLYRVKKKSPDKNKVSLTHHTIEKRVGIGYAQMCQWTKDCALLALQTTKFHLAAIVDAFISAAQQATKVAKDYGPSLWKFLNQPLIVALPVGAGVGALSGAVTAWTTASIATSKCSDTASSDAETIKRIIDELSSTQKYRAISVGV